jgi:type IV secretory pathway VirB4 component
MEAANSQDLVLLEEVREDIAILKTGAMIKIVMVGGINFFLKSEEEQNSIILTYQDFLNSLDFPIQILIHSRKVNIEDYLKRLEARRMEEPSGLLQSQIFEYQQFVRGFVSENEIMSKQFFVIVPYYPTSLAGAGDTAASLLSFGKKKDAPQNASAISNEEFKKNASSLSQRVQQILDGLSVVGLSTEVLGGQQISELFYNFYNPGTVERERTELSEK